MDKYVGNYRFGDGFGIADIALNAYEIFYTEQDDLHKLEDYGQIALGVGLLFAGPAVAAIGGIGLAAWELYEYSRDHTPEATQ